MTYILPVDWRVSIVRVDSPGVPNLERIVLRPMEEINLMSIVLAVGVRRDGGAFSPLQDLIFWFPDVVVRPPSWIIVYTGPAPLGAAPPNADVHSVQAFYWGRNETVFGDPLVAPMVFGLGSVALSTGFGPTLPDAPNTSLLAP